MKLKQEKLSLYLRVSGYLLRLGEDLVPWMEGTGSGQRILRHLWNW